MVVVIETPGGRPFLGGDDLVADADELGDGPAPVLVSAEGLACENEFSNLEIAGT
jgi:hypothetical protein